MMENESQRNDEREDATEKPSILEKHALPLSVIVASWFSGVIACGVTCSIAQAYSVMQLNHPSGKVRIAAWTWWLLAILLGIYVGLHVGKGVRSRYRRDVGEEKK